MQPVAEAQQVKTPLDYRLFALFPKFRKLTQRAYIIERYKCDYFLVRDALNQEEETRNCPSAASTGSIFTVWSLSLRS